MKSSQRVLFDVHHKILKYSEHLKFFTVRKQIIIIKKKVCSLCPLSGQPATVQVDVNGAEEGKQTQQRQGDVHLRDRESKK